MFLENHNFGTVKGSLLRESYIEDGKTKKRTIANLTGVDPIIVKNIKMAITKRELTYVDDVIERIECLDSIPCGHVEAVLNTMERIGMAHMIDPKPSRERNIILGLVAARLIKPHSNYDTSLWWASGTTLGARLGLEDIEPSEVSKAMDWLFSKKSDISANLTKRHSNEGDLFFVNVSSSYYKSSKSIFKNLDNKECLYKDKKEINRAGLNDTNEPINSNNSSATERGKTQLKYCIITDNFGHPIFIDVFPRNTLGSAFYLQVFTGHIDSSGISRVVMVGDRDLIKIYDITSIKKTSEVDFITSLRLESIKNLITQGIITSSFFKKSDLHEFSEPKDFPGERLCALRNPDLAEKRSKTRDSLIEATKKRLDKIKVNLQTGKPKDKTKIALKVNKVIDKSPVKNHFLLEIKDNFFNYSLDDKSIEIEKILDGIHVISTSLSAKDLPIEDCVRLYKNFKQVKKSFWNVKTVDLDTLPSNHKLDTLLRTYLFIPMLAYYVKLHMMEAWNELAFTDTELTELNKVKNLANVKNLVSPKKEINSAKKADKNLDTTLLSTPLPEKSFNRLLNHLGRICEIKLVLKRADEEAKETTFVRRQNFTPLQQKALDLIEKIPTYPL
ncbi:MAG: hypothetical protein LBF22_05985 [Deltaproteobacteria bacterium]|jgi:hypothetical protein|nr:hypothetical protein [Deltaproteobacteria bacterium]